MQERKRRSGGQCVSKSSRGQGWGDTHPHILDDTLGDTLAILLKTSCLDWTYAELNAWSGKNSDDCGINVDQSELL